MPASAAAASLDAAEPLRVATVPLPPRVLRP
jgi:hypothetical protein